MQTRAGCRAVLDPQGHRRSQGQRELHGKGQEPDLLPGRMAAPPPRANGDPQSPVLLQGRQPPLLQVPSTATTTASRLRLWCPLCYHMRTRSLGLNSSL